MGNPIHQKIKVTQENIINGSPGDSSCCAIAKALEDKYKNCMPLVDTNFISVRIEGKVFNAKTPENAIEFINKYDDGRDRVSPIEIDLVFEEEIKNKNPDHLSKL